MKKTALLFILSIICIPNYCQVIYGTVLDDSTKKQIQNANVFLNGSSIGTLTDKFGNFKLLLPDNQKLPIAVSSLGYSSVLVPNYQSEIPLQIFLSPKVYALDEVHVYSKMSTRQKRIRKQNLTKFKEQFFGTSLYGKSCKLINESDLVLHYFDNKDLLTANSLMPLIIYNKSLGYQIVYYLNKFEYSPHELIYIGYYIFKEDQTLKGLRRSIVENKRRLAYMNSRMQFFRSLWANNLDSSGFTIKNASNQKLNYDSLVAQIDPNTKYWKYKGIAKIYHYSTSFETIIQVQKDSVYFDKLGYYDPLGINWLLGGDMTDQRMGDQLPFDYNDKSKIH